LKICQLKTQKKHKKIYVFSCVSFEHKKYAQLIWGVSNFGEILSSEHLPFLLVNAITSTINISQEITSPNLIMNNL